MGDTDLPLHSIYKDFIHLNSRTSLIDTKGEFSAVPSPSVSLYPNLTTDADAVLAFVSRELVRVLDVELNEVAYHRLAGGGAVDECARHSAA